MYWKIWYVECILLCNLTLASPAALLTAVKEFLKFCGQQPSTFQWLFWHISEKVIIARKDSYCWRFLYRYNFHRAHRLKRSCHFKKHALKLTNLNFLLSRVNGTCKNFGNSRDYILKQNYPIGGVVCSLLDKY
jgi:hypothetical protein